MKTVIPILLIVLGACTPTNTKESVLEKAPAIGTLEIVAELDINPGYVAVSKKGRVFTTVHLMRAPEIQLIEVLKDNNYEVFPDSSLQAAPGEKSMGKLDTPLGIYFDDQDRLWIVDVGLNLGVTRLFGFDIEKRTLTHRFDIPEDLAPASSFAQDLAVDEGNGFAYLADFANPGIIVVNMNDTTFSKVTDSTMYAEDLDMVINGSVVHLNGAPARVGINPITLSKDRETIYYGAMSGTKWYSLKTEPIRTNADQEAIMATLKITGPKPISDGVDTDEEGNHYFTNLQNASIDVLSADGELSTLIQDPILDWPDNVRSHGDWLYIAVNQLHKSPPFTGGEEQAELPYRIVRVKFR